MQVHDVGKTISAFAFLVWLFLWEGTAFASVHEPIGSSYDAKNESLRDELIPIDTGKSEAQATLAIVREELQRDPTNVELRRKKGYCLYILHEVDLAISELEALLYEHPKDSRTVELLAAAYHWKATLRLRSGDAASASSLIERALALVPGEPYFLSMKAEVLSKMGRHRGALRYMREALKQYPDDAEMLHQYEEIKTALQESRPRRDTGTPHK